MAVLYMVGMSQLEEETQGFWQSLAVAGVPLIQARIPERTAATIIGRWVQDEFHAEVSAETVLRPGGF